MEDGLKRVLAHGFLQGLSTGDLSHEQFGYFIVQDTLYLNDYARALSLLAAKAPSYAASTVAAHASATVATELELHPALLTAAGLDPSLLTTAPKSPATTAYASYLLAVCAQRPFHEGLAAVLPCYWIYEQVGRTLVERGSPVPVYQRWIEAYAAENFADSVAEMLDVVDRVVGELPEAEVARMAEHIEVTTRYEWMFWDAALRDDRWPW